MVERKTVISVHGEAEKEVTLDFEDLLVFLTGLWYLPTVGTITGKLNFKHQNIKIYVLFLVCFTQQSSLLKPLHLFILLIIWSYVFVFNNYRELLLFTFAKHIHSV